MINEDFEVVIFNTDARDSNRFRHVSRLLDDVRMTQKTIPELQADLVNAADWHRTRQSFCSSQDMSEMHEGMADRIEAAADALGRLESGLNRAYDVLNGDVELPAHEYTDQNISRIAQEVISAALNGGDC